MNAAGLFAAFPSIPSLMGEAPLPAGGDGEGMEAGAFAEALLATLAAPAPQAFHQVPPAANDTDAGEGAPGAANANLAGANAPGEAPVTATPPAASAGATALATLIGAGIAASGERAVTASQPASAAQTPSDVPAPESAGDIRPDAGATTAAAPGLVEREAPASLPPTALQKIDEAAAHHPEAAPELPPLAGGDHPRSAPPAPASRPDAANVPPAAEILTQLPGASIRAVLAVQSIPAAAVPGAQPAAVIEEDAAPAEPAAPLTAADAKAGQQTRSKGHEARRSDAAVATPAAIAVGLVEDEAATVQTRPLETAVGKAEERPAGGEAPLDAAEPARAQPTVRTELAANIDAPARTPAGPAAKAGPETVSDLAAQLTDKLAARASRFEIQLDPLGLGKVDVKVEINHRGELTAALHFENPAAAQELRARAAELQSALQQAGFDLTKTALHFSGGGDFGQGLWNQNQQPDRQTAAFDRHAFVDLSDTPDAQPAPSRPTRSGGVDLTV